MESIYNISLDDLENFFLNNNLKKFKAKQVYKCIYEKKEKSFNKMSDLSKDTIVLLNNNFIIDDLKIKRKQMASDGTVKFLFVSLKCH